MKTIAITGGSGLLAMNWAVAMRNRAKICLFTHKHAVNIAGVESTHVPLEDVVSIKRALKDRDVDLVVHTAGMTSVDECERQPELAHIANVDLARNVAMAARDLGVRLVHISTDHLFQGDKALVDEQERPNPINMYGRTKFIAEERVSALDPNALLVRTNFYGWGHANRNSFSDWIVQSLKQGKGLTAFSDVYFTPTLIDDLVRAIHDLLDKPIAGVLHIVGEERVSKFEFAIAVAEQFGYNTTLIKEGSIANSPLLASRPRDMSLNNGKAMELIGRPIGALKAGLQALHEQAHCGRPKELIEATLDRTRGVA